MIKHSNLRTISQWAMEFKSESLRRITSEKMFSGMESKSLDGYVDLGEVLEDE